MSTAARTAKGSRTKNVSSLSTDSTTKGTSRTQQSSSNVSTPTSTMSASKILVNSSILPYQYLGETRIRSSCAAPLPKLCQTHHTMRLGSGTPINNLKVAHIVSSKKESLVTNPMRKIVPAFLLNKAKTPTKQSKTTPGGDSGSSITSRMKMLTIYESPPPPGTKQPISSITGSGSNSISNVAEESLFEKVFLNLEKKANYLAVLNRKVTFIINTGGKTITVLPLRNNGNSDNMKEENNQAISGLCRHFRNLMGWKMSLHINWKYAEERVKLWHSQQLPVLSVEDVAGILKISPSQLRLLKIIPDVELIFNVLRKNHCHINFQNIARMLALSKLQEGKPESACRFISESNGMFLQSEIIDKHLTYIRRTEEQNSEAANKESDKVKSKIFWEQVSQTLEFGNSCFGNDGEKQFSKLTTFDPEWNIVQISSSFQSSNRFGYELIGKRKVPQLILSVFANVPGQKSNERSNFTTYCCEPPLEPGSLMRNGLVEEFEKLLDRNLMISDEKIMVSRKKYWEERSRHNETLESIMYAMEDWIFPWSFLLPGTINDKEVRKLITEDVLTHPTLKKSTSTQRLLIYRLAENYNSIPIVLRNVLDSLVAYILQVDEESVTSLVNTISDVGCSISTVAPRHPTILVLDQDLDILPWDYLPCLRTTSVTRMPSLNIIRSTKSLSRLIGGEYPRNIDSSKCTFILNPDKTLPQVQSRLEKYFRDREEWIPIVARSPTAQEMQNAIENQDLFLYCGHGAGSNFYPEYAIQKLVCKAIPMLMGCSSAQSHFNGPRLYANSSVHAYLIAGCTSVVGFLWEVTDTECDRITVDLIERWTPHPSAPMPKMPIFDSDSKRPRENDLSSALRKSRTAATQLLTQCSVVCYGLPVIRAE